MVGGLETARPTDTHSPWPLSLLADAAIANAMTPLRTLLEGEKNTDICSETVGAKTALAR